VTPLDLALVLAGRSYAVVSRGGRAVRGVNALVVVLFAITLLALLVIALTPIPLELSLGDLRDGRYPDRSSWLRLEGILEHTESSSPETLRYVLRDRSDPSLAVTIIAPGALPTGATDVTGRALGGVRAPGTFEAFYADVPTEPARHDPWLLIALPSIVALILLLGERVGYPVMRGSSAGRSRSAEGAGPEPLAPGESVAARWNGRIGSEDLPLGDGRACSVAVLPGDDVVTLVVTDEHGIRRVPVRRATPKRSGRACRTFGCRAGVEVHATGSDIIFELDSTANRDRLAASLV